jgi:hypothetical protein
MGVFDDILGSDGPEEEEIELELDLEIEGTGDFDYDLKKLLDKVFDDIIEENKLDEKKDKKSKTKWYPKKVISEYYENRSKNYKKGKRT